MEVVLHEVAVLNQGAFKAFCGSSEPGAKYFPTNKEWQAVKRPHAGRPCGVPLCPRWALF